MVVQNFLNYKIFCYSTVTKSSPTGLDPHLDKGYHLTMVLEVSSSNLWMSPYSQHQQMLFDLIRSKHEDEGWNFKKISDWLVENNYSTPRGNDDQIQSGEGFGNVDEDDL